MPSAAAYMPFEDWMATLDDDERLKLMSQDLLTGLGTAVSLGIVRHVCKNFRPALENGKVASALKVLYEGTTSLLKAIYEEAHEVAQAKTEAARKTAETAVPTVVQSFLEMLRSKGYSPAVVGVIDLSPDLSSSPSPTPNDPTKPKTLH